MIKPTIKFCTPYYNEWEPDENGTPIRNSVLTPIEESFDKLAGGLYDPRNGQCETERFSWVWRRCKGTWLDENRNALVNCMQSRAIKQSPELGYDIFVFLDADISFTYENIVMLLDHSLPIIGGAFQERAYPEYWTAGYYDKDSYGVNGYVGKDAHGLVEVDWLGGGCFMVRREVFENTAYPWFENYHHKYTNENGEVCANPVKDDVSLCIKAKEAGYKIYIDADCVLGHHFNKKGASMNPEQEKQKSVDIRDWTLAMKDHVDSVNAGISFIQKQTTELINRIGSLSTENASLKATIENMKKVEVTQPQG